MTSQNQTYRATESEPPFILIVDDEEDIVEILETVVMDLGYTPLVAHNGQQALLLARTHWPALVLTDLMMPILSGPDLIRGLHTEAEAQGRPSPPIIVLTAGSTQAARQLEVDATFGKPFDITKLEQMIQRLLHN